MITLELLPQMGEVINLPNHPNESIPMRGAGWYGHTTGLHTVAVRALNFQGRVYIQASIATNPQSDPNTNPMRYDQHLSDGDWFNVIPNDQQFTLDCGYIQYPHRNYIIQSPSNGETSIIGFNFMSNVVWVRAFVVRDYFIPPTTLPIQIMAYGVIDYIKLSY